MSRVAAWVLLTIAVALPAWAGELELLKQEFDVVSERADEEALAEQADLLNRIADLDTPRARKTLERLRKTWAGMNWRRDRMILTALVRQGDAEAIDDAIRWVETKERGRRDPRDISVLTVRGNEAQLISLSAVIDARETVAPRGRQPASGFPPCSSWLPDRARRKLPRTASARPD